MTHYYEAHQGTSTTIILPFERPLDPSHDRPALPARRGRPKTRRKSGDTGTPELVMKRLLGATAETLDLLLDRRIIDAQQHWCGIHLRWLYSLRFGAPSIRTLNLTDTPGIEWKLDDPLWSAAREAEYNEAMQCLTNNGRAQAIINVCIHNERPRFLNTLPGKKNYTREAVDLIVSLKEGLDMLCTLWGKKKG